MSAHGIACPAVLVAACAAGLLAVPARADEPRLELEPGARVRVLAAAPSKNWLVGRVSAVSADTMYFIPEETSGPMPVALAEPAQIQMSSVRHSGVRRGMVLGGLIGGTFGALIVTGHQLGYDVKEDIVAAYSGVAPPHQRATLAPVFVGLASGCALGAVFGASTSIEHWVPAKLPMHLALGGALDATGSVRLGVMATP